MKRDFAHLHLHTEYSLLDGSGKIKKIIERVKELGMTTVAITDHGSMYGCVDFYKAAKEAGIKPIIGCEVYVAGKSRHIKLQDKDNETFHLVLLVKNEVGYQNLMKIVSEASINGFYYKPRVDYEFLKENSEGLIALSACLGGEIQKNLSRGNIEKAKERALLYKECFKEGFYLELQYHGVEEQLKVNQLLLELSKETEIPLVATNDVHYIKKEDAKSHDVLLCIQTAKTVDEEDRMRYPSDEFYLKSPEEMYTLFGYASEALENTVKIAEQCNFDYIFHESKLPNFPLPDDTDHFQYLKEVCYKGLRERYDDISAELTERLEYELDVIDKMGYTDYFLIVWDFIRFANESYIPTGPGRGSAAGSLVAFTLGITKIDPIKYSLIFERFLNPERISMPDIDSDFCYERRQEVIDYVVEKYGKESVSQIVTFGTMAARGCIRDVGRAMSYSYAEVDVIAKMIPTMLGITIERALEITPELKEAYEGDLRIKELIDVARSLEGLPRHTSIHAAGVVIASKPLVNFVPLLRNEEAIVTQFPMGTLEELGLLKMDFLGLRTLTVINDAIAMVRENRGIEIDIDNLDYDDSKVYNMIGDGKTVGVFQLESPGMTSFMKELKPDNLEDIIAGISLYRPGPMAEIPRYIENKKNVDAIEYITPHLEGILDVTYGVMVYQEQVMQIVRDLAGYSLGRSDLVRRAMSKKKHKVMEEERKNFIYGIKDEEGNEIVAGCMKNGITAEAANKIFDQMMDFASYAFNKSHAAAYAVVGFQTAYLMCYYPTEFIAAMLNSVMGINEKVSFYVRFAREQGIEVLPPDINKSSSKFTVSGNTIRFGLAAIKNVGVNVVENIVKSRAEKGEFKDFMDFVNKIDTSMVNKRAVESFIKCGVFDSFTVFRSRLLAIFEKILDGVSSQRKKNIDGQLSLFGGFSSEVEEIKLTYPNIKEFEKKYILAMEKEMTGLYLSGHPLDEYIDTLNNATSTNTSDIIGSESLDDEVQKVNSYIKDNDLVIIGGILTEVSKKVTRNNTMMAFVKLEDLYGTIEVIVFPKTFQKNIAYLHEDSLVTIKGRVAIKEDEAPKIICDEIKPLIKQLDEKIYIRVENEAAAKEAALYLRRLPRENKGYTPVYIFVAEKNQAFVINKELWVSSDIDTMMKLRGKLGEENIKVK